METNHELIETANDIIENAVALPTEDKKPSALSIGILIFALIGVGSTGYFIYKGVRYVVTKLKDGSLKVEKAPEKKEEPKEAKEEPKAEESTEEK